MKASKNFVLKMPKERESMYDGVSLLVVCTCVFFTTAIHHQTSQENIHTSHIHRAHLDEMWLAGYRKFDPPEVFNFRCATEDIRKKWVCCDLASCLCLCLSALSSTCILLWWCGASLSCIKYYHHTGSITSSAS